MSIDYHIFGKWFYFFLQTQIQVKWYDLNLMCLRILSFLLGRPALRLKLDLYGLILIYRQSVWLINDEMHVESLCEFEGNVKIDSIL